MQFETLIQTLFLSTVRIETTETDESEEKLGVGTGFIFSYEPEHFREGQAHFFLVTNKHVVENGERVLITMLRSGGAGTTLLGQGGVQVALPRFEEAWFGHPDPRVDIAVLYLEPMIAYRAEPSGPTIGELTSAAPIRSIHIPTPEHIETLDAIEEVLFIGYPDGLYDYVNLTPIARKGITATPLHLDYAGDPVFVIDASVFPGSSGSPVLAYPNTIRSNSDRDVTLVGSQMMLLGVLSEVFVTTQEGKVVLRQIAPSQDEPSSPSTPSDMSIEVEQMIDLGYVYKSSTVLETIEHYIEKHSV